MAQALFTLLFFLILSSAVWVGGILVGRLLRREPLLRFEPRRQVPWDGWDLLAIFAVYLVCGAVLGQVVITILGPEMTKAPVIEDPSILQANHPIVSLFHDANWLTRVACLIMAVVVAPITEEILFRLFLQGWLEKLDRRLLRPSMPGLARLFRWGTLPVVITSILFALLHFRGEVRQYKPDYFLFVMTANAVVSLLTAALAVAIARRRCGASWADLGWVPGTLARDVRLGLAAFAAVAVPVFVLQYVLKLALPARWTADPVPLFFFAAVLGTLYLRTHRITPSIVTHMALNGVTMLLLWMQIG